MTIEHLIRAWAETCWAIAEQTVRKADDKLIDHLRNNQTIAERAVLRAMCHYFDVQGTQAINPHPGMVQEIHTSSSDVDEIPAIYGERLRPIDQFIRTWISDRDQLPIDFRRSYVGIVSDDGNAYLTELKPGTRAFRIWEQLNQYQDMYQQFLDERERITDDDESGVSP